MTAEDLCSLSVRLREQAKRRPARSHEMDVTLSAHGNVVLYVLRRTIVGLVAATRQVLNLRTRPSSSLDSISRLLESARAESERLAINCASPWIWLMCRLMSSAT
ncbi:hypothetical protein SAMN05216597_2013 [Pseudomonas cannabina]|nr:hypothetical protein SAMN05216597_2013 [Pseudomonas cannabina]